MKRNSIFSKIGMTLAIALVSCTDLDIEDKTALTPAIALDKVESFRSVLFSAYSAVNEFGFYGRATMLDGDVLADNMDVVQFNGRLQNEMVNEIGSHFIRWQLYGMINDCNIVIGLIDGAGVAGSQEAKDVLKGEAHFLRALAYHELLRSYSYEPNRTVNGFNLGVVMRTTPVIGLSNVTDAARGTIDEGYDLLEDDLLTAIALLPSQTAGSLPAGAGNFEPRYRASKEAAHALLARVYLYEGEYEDAAEQADLALATTIATLVDSAGYVASWAATPHPESIFESELRATDWSTVDGSNSSLHSYTSNATAGNFFTLSPSEEYEDEVAEDPMDVRNTMIVTNNGFRILQKWRGEKGTFLENVPVIRYSEVLLTAAEAKARSGDETGAQEDISRFRAARIEGAPDVAVTGPALINLILRERRLELIAEGHRFFDLKRLGLPITKSTAAKNLGATDLQYSDFRVLARIPVGEVNISNSLQQNPGY